MSTAQERAAAAIAVIVAEGHSIVLVRSAYRDGTDGVMTMFSIDQPRVVDAATAALAASYQPDNDEDRAALKAELIARGWVQ